jgi:hypothetical protein
MLNSHSNWIPAFAGMTWIPAFAGMTWLTAGAMLVEAV